MSSAFTATCLISSAVLFVCAIALAGVAARELYLSGRRYLREAVSNIGAAILIAFVSGCAFVPPFLKLLGKV